MRKSFALLGIAFAAILIRDANAAIPPKADTPPARFAYPADIGGANNVTTHERRTLRALKNGNVRAAMYHSTRVIADRVSLPAEPKVIACAGYNGISRWTCSAKAGKYQLVSRVIVAPGRNLVVTRTVVKWHGTAIASAWAAQKGKRVRLNSPTIRRLSARPYKRISQRVALRILLETSPQWKAQDRRITNQRVGLTATIYPNVMIVRYNAVNARGRTIYRLNARFQRRDKGRGVGVTR